MNSKQPHVTVLSALSLSALMLLPGLSAQAQSDGTRKAYSSYGSSGGSGSFSSTYNPSYGSGSSSGSFSSTYSPSNTSSSGSSGNSSSGSFSSAGSGNSSSGVSLSGYTPPSSSSSGDSNNATGGGGIPTDANSNGSTHTSKFGSLMRGLRHELNSTGVVRNPSYQNQNQNGYYNSSPYGNAQSSNAMQVPPGTNVVRNLDGSYHLNGPGVSGNQSFHMAQPTPQISGDVANLATSNMPVSISGDIDSLFPAELHAKAYGPELKRNAPLNGAEGRNPAY